MRGLLGKSRWTFACGHLYLRELPLILDCRNNH
jgi:hypothetical protein